jgi:DNA-binding CsgD family transcriptional regulator
MTVEFHKYRIMRQLGIRTTAGLTRYAIARGLIAP